MKLSRPQFISINIGNTHISISHSNEKILRHSHLNYLELVATLKQWLHNHKDTFILSCSVVSDKDIQSRYIEVFNLLTTFPHKLDYRSNWQSQQSKKSFFSMPVHYAETLGMDRLIQAYFLWKNLKQQNLQLGLMIDAGTMTTIDVVSLREGFLGGYILPGIDRYAEIFQVSQKLPLKKELLPLLTGTTPRTLPATTTQAISYAYWHSNIALLQQLHSHFSIETITISGGNAQNWANNMEIWKKSIVIDPLFPHRALWQIGEDMLELSSI